MPGDEYPPLETCLERLRLGDESARAELIERAQDRLRRLAHQRLRHWPKLQRWVETDDVLNAALTKLYVALKDVRPESSQHFARLAACQIRRELIDLGRKLFGPEGLAARHATPPLQSPGADTPVSPFESPQSTHDPQGLASWTELHDQVEKLPDDEREVFEHLWYLGLSQTETAEALGVDRTTVIRRWHRARSKLVHALKGNLPGTP